MQFHLEHQPEPPAVRIAHSDPLLLIGSCFTENIGALLRQQKFSILENPHGILFNPASIVRAIDDYCSCRIYAPDDLFSFNEGWHSWNHHSRFSAPAKEDALRKINTSIETANAFLQKARWVMITLGSAFVYSIPEGEEGQQQSGRIVANCHKVPADRFLRRLLSANELDELLDNLHSMLLRFNPGARIIYTISPVRHLRDGFVENNRSKAALITAVHRQTERHPEVGYFPAYELVIDDLRDYRFYAEDLVHPNYAATRYVWEKFMSTCLDAPAQELIKQLYPIRAAFTHRPFNTHSVAHRKFLADHLAKLRLLRQQHPHLDLAEEERYFINC